MKVIDLSEKRCASFRKQTKKLTNVKECQILLSRFRRSKECCGLSHWVVPHLRLLRFAVTLYTARVLMQSFSEQEAFEKCWAHSPLRAAARPFTRCRYRYCRAPPVHRCLGRQRRTTTTTTRDRGDHRYGPMEWAQ